MRFPCVRICWMLQHTANTIHCIEREPETASVITRTIVLSTPSNMVYLRHLAPQLTRGMCHDRRVSHIVPRISLYIPAIASERLVYRFFVRKQHSDHKFPSATGFEPAKGPACVSRPERLNRVANPDAITFEHLEGLLLHSSTVRPPMRTSALNKSKRKTHLSSRVISSVRAFLRSGFRPDPAQCYSRVRSTDQPQSDYDRASLELIVRTESPEAETHRLSRSKSKTAQQWLFPCHP